jgi:hypothetical protein
VSLQKKACNDRGGHSPHVYALRRTPREATESTRFVALFSVTIVLIPLVCADCAAKVVNPPATAVEAVRFITLRPFLDWVSSRDAGHKALWTSIHFIVPTALFLYKNDHDSGRPAGRTTRLIIRGLPGLPLPPSSLEEDR